jgi:hypothetical protein
MAFINNTSSLGIKPFPYKKIITYADYINKYNCIHAIISKFYGDLSPESFQKYFERIKILIKKGEENKIFTNDESIKMIEGLSVFQIKDDMEKQNELIIKEITNNCFYSFLNKSLIDLDINETVAYFVSRLMYSLNSYALKKNMYMCTNDKQLYRGDNLPYTQIIQYEQAKGNIILLKSFTDTTEDENLAKSFVNSNNNIDAKFGVIFIITNKYKDDWVSNGINIQNISVGEKKNEIIFLPFSFYLLKDVVIDFENNMAQIYLETIGKNEILEEKIKSGQTIQFNAKKGAIEINNKYIKYI